MDYSHEIAAFHLVRCHNFWTAGANRDSDMGQSKNHIKAINIQNLICIPRVLDQHQIVTSKNCDISLNEKQLFHENNPSIIDRSSIYLSIDQSIHQYDQ